MKAMQIAFVWWPAERWRQNRMNPNGSHVSVSACTKVSTTMPMVIRCDCQGFEGNDHRSVMSHGFSGIRWKKNHLWYHIVMLYNACPKISIRIERWPRVSKNNVQNSLQKGFWASFAVLSGIQQYNSRSSYRSAKWTNLTLSGQTWPLICRHDKVKTLGCGHVFHADCMEQWGQVPFVLFGKMEHGIVKSCRRVDLRNLWLELPTIMSDQPWFKASYYSKLLRLELVVVVL